MSAEAPSVADRVRGTTRLATRIAVQRAATAWVGHVGKDPLALLTMRPGRVDPYRVYDRLRERGPVSRSRFGVWTTVGHAETSAVLRDRRFGVTQPGMLRAAEDLDLSFLERDPPDHTRLRRLAAPAFTPRRIDAFRPRVEQLGARLVEDALVRSEKDGRVDLVAALAAPLPIAVITDLLGIPDADTDRFARHGAVIGSALDGVRSVRHARRIEAARTDLDGLLRDLAERRRHDPADDLLSRLVAAEGDELDPGELLPLCRLLLVAGFETTVNLVGNAVHALIANPAQWAALQADPGLADAVVEETLRYDPPVQRTARVAHEHVPVGDVTVRPGQWVVTFIGAANRDPAVHHEPDRFDLYRVPTVEHLAFSAGIHYCAGAPLARLEAAAALRTLAERVDLAPAGRPTRRPGTTLRGLLTLPVTLRRR